MFSLFSSSSVDPDSSWEVEEIVVTEAEEQSSHVDPPGPLTTERTSQSTSEPSSWNEALHRYCVDKGVLRATMHQIVHGLGTPEDSQLPWELPATSVLPTQIDDIVKPFCSNERMAVENEARGGIRQLLWDGASRLGSSLMSTVLQKDEIDLDYENEALQEIEGTTTTSTSSSALNWDVPIIHVDFTNTCLQKISMAIYELAKNEQSAFKIMEKSEWRQFCSQTNDDLLSRLPPEDLDWLLEILIRKGEAKVVKNEGLSELIVLSSTTLPPGEDSTVDIAIALHKLSQAQSTLELRMENWAGSIQECQEKAARHKAAKQTSLAIVQLRKSKLLQKQIDSSANALLELEKVRSTIELTQSNQVILGLLAESSTQLRNLTQQTTLEEVDEVKENLEENMAVAGQISESLGTNPTVDENELLAELEMLTLIDNTATSQARGSGLPNSEISKTAVTSVTRETQSEVDKEVEAREPVMA